MTPALLRALLKEKVEQGLRRQTLNHLRSYLADICKCAGGSKLVVGLEQYADAWKLLAERKRLCFDLVMFAGKRESEVFALWCGDINGQGMQIERSFDEGRYEAPKSQRTVGVPDEIMERLKSWTSKLPVSGAKDCVFPSTTLATPIWPESVLRKYVRPKLRPANLGGSILQSSGVRIPLCTNSGTQTLRSSPINRATE